jgi:hypothetical protein
MSLFCGLYRARTHVQFSCKFLWTNSIGRFKVKIVKGIGLQNLRLI